MLISHADAVAVFNAFDKSLQLPSLHPDYVVIDACRDPSLQPSFFLYEEKDNFFYHAFHVGRVLETDYYDIQSPYGYGGIISSSHDPDFLKRASNNYLHWGQENNILAEFVRFHPLLKNKYYYGTTRFNRNTVWVDLENKDVLSSYSYNMRNQIRKSLKQNLRVEWLQAKDFLPLFVPLYEQQMNLLNAGSFYYFPENYYDMLTNWEHAHLGVSWYEDQILALGMFLVSGDYMEYHLSTSSAEGKVLRGTDILLHNAFLLGQKIACKVCHLGGGRTEHDEDALFFYKRRYSNLQGEFQIGSYIHNPEAYIQLKESMQYTGQRTLFYR